MCQETGPQRDAPAASTALLTQSTRCTTRGDRCKVQTQEPLFKHEEFQDGNSRALNQVWALLGGGLCDCADCTPVSQALQAHTAQDAIQPTEKT